MYIRNVFFLFVCLPGFWGEGVFLFAWGFFCFLFVVYLFFGLCAFFFACFFGGGGGLFLSNFKLVVCFVTLLFLTLVHKQHVQLTNH